MSITMTLRLDEEMNERLASLAGATERSKAYLATQALKLFLDNNEWQVQEINKAVKAADEAAADQFVDNDKVTAWMDTWGSDNESLPPL
jgi:RHH-type rel operon transcriptional repressor/antitoxin RelB